MSTLVDLLKSSALIQGMLALALTGAIIYQVLNGQPASEALLTLDGAIVGYYFGTKTEQSINRAVQRGIAQQGGEHG